MNNNFMLSFFSDIWGEMINTLRSINPTVKMCIYVGCAILALACLIKAFKVNFNAKNEKKMNFFWFFPIVLIVLFIWMLSL